MEFTRKQLENLTTSEEFKRHQANSIQMKRQGAVSRSLMYGDSDEDSVNDLGRNSAAKSRLNNTELQIKDSRGKPMSPLGLIKKTPSTAGISDLKPR